MKTRIGAAGALMLSIFALNSCARAPEAAPAAPIDPNAVQIMVVGAFHMGNPGQDVANVEVDNMLAEKRQHEIAAAVDAIAAFKPTLIAVERITPAPDYIDPKYPAFTTDQLATIADERYQIAYRLANIEGLAQVYGVDEQPDDGEPDYFPFDKVAAQAEATGQTKEFDQQIADIQAASARLGAMQKDHTVAQLLIEYNRGGELSSNDFYYRMFQYDRGEDQPGAELQAYWFMRNAKIFSKLLQVAKSGDRVVIVYGSGHKFWLDHFADNTPGVVRIDPIPYLEKAAK